MFETATDGRRASRPSKLEFVRQALNDFNRLMDRHERRSNSKGLSDHERAELRREGAQLVESGKTLGKMLKRLKP
jgi:hypothetical protein